jgi:hypothetical protein
MTFDKLRSLSHFLYRITKVDVKMLDWSIGDVGDVDEHNAMTHSYKKVYNLITRSMLALAQSHR